MRIVHNDIAFSDCPSSKNLQKLEQLGAMSQIPCGNDKPVGMTNQQVPGKDSVGLSFPQGNLQQ